jgi:hypothetical protein
LRINFLQSLVQGLCVAAEKRETEGTTEKNKRSCSNSKKIATKTKDKKRDREEKSEYSCCCSKLISFILCDYICVQARVSKQGLA